MRMTGARITLLVFAALIVTTAVAGARTIEPAGIDVPLSRGVSVRDLGRAPANYPVSIVVTLPYRNADELERLIQAQGTPGSRYYRRFLSSQQFAARYGPSSTDQADVTSELIRAGFRITQRFANRTVIDATAPAIIAERYFRTEIHVGSQAGHGIRYYNVRPAVIPAELLTQAYSVLGLSNLVVSSPSRQPVQADHPNSSRVGAPLEGEQGFGPLALAQGYDLPVQHGYGGTDIRIAELENAASIPSGYVQTYVWGFDLHPPATMNTTLVKVDGGCPPASSNCGIGEGDDWTDFREDREFLAALAPGAENELYQLPEDTFTTYVDGANEVVADNTADVATMFVPYVLEDQPGDETLALSLDHIFAQGAALGITFVTENFGTRTSDCVCLSTPADSPHVLALGGSVVSVDSRGDYKGESFGCDLDSSIWDGVLSRWFPRPSYQAGIKGTSPNGRMAPDLAAGFCAAEWTKPQVPPVSDVAGFSFFAGQGATGWNYELYPNDSPVLALIAEIDQMGKSRSGLINTALYALYKKQKYGPTKTPAFHNITQTDSASINLGSGFNAMGIGSFDGWNLANALLKAR
jgi:kumamolisin